MDEKKIIDNIVESLGNEKNNFLNNVENKVRKYIEAKSIKECLTFVERNTDGSVYVHWYPSEIGSGYVKCLVAFCRKKTYRGKELDSALTDGVVQQVTEEFNNFYSEKSEILSKHLLPVLFNDKVFLKVFTSHLAESLNKTLPASAKSKLMGLLTQKLEDSFNTHIINLTGHSISSLATKVVASASAIPISHALAMLILKTFAVTLKGVIAKVLASAAVKSMIMAAVKKIAAAKILTVIIALVGSKLGITTGAAVAFVLIPLIIAFIGYEFYTLPKKLAEKVSVEIRNELSSSYNTINRNVIGSIISDIAKTGAQTFALQLSQELEMKEIMNTLLKEIS